MGDKKMEITDIEVIPYRIPNRSDHEIAYGTLSALENVLVLARTNGDIRGVGEAVSAPKWNSNVVEALEELIRSHLAPSLIGKDPFNIADIWETMDRTVSGHYAAKAAIDVAVHDLIGRILDIPVSDYLGGTHRTTIEVEGPGFGIGFMDPADAADFALRAYDEGCRQIEVKGGHPTGWERDLEAIKTVYEACDSAIDLKVDLNEAYDYKTALRVLPKMYEHGVRWVEQPLPRQQLSDLSRLRDGVDVGIILDESVGHPTDVLEIAETRAADAIHLKYPMLGGFTMCRDIAAICKAADIGIQGGTSTPSGVGLAAVHQFTATLPNLVRGCHGSPLGRATDDIIANPVDAFAPVVEIGDDPGIGVELDMDKLDEYRTNG